MGSEQSAQSHLGPTRSGSLNRNESEKPTTVRRQHTIANPGERPLSEHIEGGVERPGSTSPGPSVCSDSDLPYISYTVNRPIGDSPKMTKNMARAKSSQRKFTSVRNVKKTTAHNIVVVKPALSGPNSDKDPDIVRLQVRIHQFYASTTSVVFCYLILVQ